MEAPFEETEHGPVCKGEGWFLVNARDVRWRESKGRGVSSNFGGDTLFDQLGVGITVVGPGEPTTMYHWESNEEDFIVVRGGGVAVLDGHELPLAQWDVVHCPPRTAHVADPVAARLGAARERNTDDTREAYKRFGPREPVRYGGWLD